MLQSLQHYLEARLSTEGAGNIKPDHFAELAGRLLASGVLWRDYSKPEAQAYDAAVQCEQLLREYFAAIGFVLTHDLDAMLFRLYPPGGTGDGEDDGVKKLKARLSPTFVAACVALRFLYTEGLTGKRELIDEQLVISLEELSQAVVSLLGHALPASASERLALLRDLKKHRIVRFHEGDDAGHMDMLIGVLRPVMSFVSDEALEDALALAKQAAQHRRARAPKPTASTATDTPVDNEGGA